MCNALLTSFVGRGLAPAVILFGQSGTPVPTVRRLSFWHKQMISKKASFAMQGRWLRALARRRWDRFAGDHRSPLRGAIKKRQPGRGELRSPAATPIKNFNDYNPSVALRRQLPLLKGAFKLGLFVQEQCIFFNL